MQIDLSHKIAVVTGGTGELGRVMVRTLAAAGADVAIQYLHNRAQGETLLAEVRQLGRRACLVQADVTTEASVLALRDQVRAALGDAHIIVNNAVIQYQPHLPLLEQSAAEFDGQYRSCVLHNVFMAKAFVPAMIQHKYGRVIATNTELVMNYPRRQSAYVSGKGGQDRLLRVLAREVGEHGITVNQVAPGWTVSEKFRGTPQERQPEYEKTVALQRRGTDQEIANVVAFLASDLASFVTGAIIPVCGGTVMPAV